MRDPDKVDFTEIDQLDRQARHRLHDAHRLLVPNLRGLAKAQTELPPALAHIDRLSPGERSLFNLRLQLAHADVLDLHESLCQFRNLIAAEIRRFHSGRLAIAAYVRPIKNLKPGRSN